MPSEIILIKRYTLNPNDLTSYQDEQSYQPIKKDIGEEEVSESPLNHRAVDYLDHIWALVEPLSTP